MKRTDQAAEIVCRQVQRGEKGFESMEFRHVDMACEFHCLQGADRQDDRVKRAVQAEPAEEHRPHLNGSRYETPAFCHFRRQVQFIKRSVRFLGDISCFCLFYWKSLLPTAIQHTSPQCPGHAWRHMQCVIVLHTGHTCTSPPCS